jgi:hypothetical protein
MNDGSFTMSGANAEISRNYASLGGGTPHGGGGVSMYTLGSTFTMSGENAKISDNCSGEAGGGVRMLGAFTMSGANATISGNTGGTGGGGVYMAISGASFLMSGANATISNNTGGGNGGGGVWVAGSTTFTMSSGMILNNTVPTVTGKGNFRNDNVAQWPAGTKAYTGAYGSLRTDADIVPDTGGDVAVDMVFNTYNYTDGNIWAER